MCGRYTLHASGEQVAQQFALPTVPDLPPRYNIAPTQAVAVVRQTARTRELAWLRWGLVPPWADSPAIGARMINARAETVADKPSFRHALRQRRCLIIADGFYEWHAVAGARRAGRRGSKTPYYMQLADGAPFAFAGLWEVWRHGDGFLETCTIITTEPNRLLAPIHNRMPVILSPEHYALWLAPALHDDRALTALLQPYPPDAMRARPVSCAVNNAAHDAPDCIAPLAR